MLLGADIAMFVIGLALVIQGRFNLTKNLVVAGVPARIVGLIAILPWPLTEVIASVIGVVIGMTSSSGAQNQLKLVFALSQFGLLIGSAIAAYAVALRYARNPNKSDPDKPLVPDPEVRA